MDQGWNPSEDFRQVLESSPLALVATDAEGRVLLVNANAEALFGYGRAELLGTLIGRLVPALADGEALRCLSAGGAAGPHPPASQHALNGTRRDGTQVPLSVHLSSIESQGGPVVVVRITDLSEAETRERELRESRELMATVTSGIPGAIFRRLVRADGALAYSYFAGRITERWNLTAEDMLRNPGQVLKFIHPDDLGAVARALDGKNDDLAPRTTEFRMLTPEGEPRWIEMQTYADPRSAAEPARNGILLDVTDLKNAEAALAESERRFRAIVANVPGTVFQQVFGPDGTVTYTFLSEGIKQQLGYPAQQVLADPSLLERAYLPEELRGRQIAEAEGRSGLPFRSRQFRVRRADGAIRWLQTSSSSHRTPAGDVVWDGITLDITQDKLGQIAQEERERQADTELNLAAMLQKRLFRSAQVPPHLAAAIHFHPASPVSGDLLFSRITREGEFFCFIGDATGHGVAAGLLTMLTVALLESSDLSARPGQILQRLNDQLTGYDLEGRYVSGIAAKIHPNGSLVAANAGHPPAMVAAAPRAPAQLIASSGSPLGWFPQQEYEDVEFELQPGAKLLLYTDGFTEWPDAKGVELGSDVLQRALRESAAPETMIERLLVAARAHAKSKKAPDDVTLAAIRYQP